MDGEGILANPVHNFGIAMRTDAQHIIAGNKGKSGKNKTGSQSCLLRGIGRRVDPNGGSAQHVRNADIQRHFAKVLFTSRRARTMGKQLHIVAGLHRPGNTVLLAENFYVRQLKVTISYMKQLIKP